GVGLRGTAGAATRGGAAGRLEARRDLPRQAGPGRGARAGPRPPGRRGRTGPRFAAGGGGAHSAPVRAGDRVHHGRGPVRAFGHLVGGAGGRRGGGGGHRGARLALHRLQVHDAGRGRGPHVGGAVRGGFGR